MVCRQERAGVDMADGFTRAANGRRIGVFAMQHGPGAENAFGGVAQAWADSTPLLLLPGGHPRARSGVPGVFDAVDHYRGVTRWAAQVNVTARIPELLGRAFTLLRSAPAGPVLVEVPLEVGNDELPGDGEAGELHGYRPVVPHRSAVAAADVRDLVAAFLAAEERGQSLTKDEALQSLREAIPLILHDRREGPSWCVRQRP